jgi:dolichyl-phosphate-mannose-protein mannosyltransferase
MSAAVQADTTGPGVTAVDAKASIDAEAITPDDATEPHPPRSVAVPETVRRRLATGLPFDPYSWLATGVVVVIAAVLRLYHLSHPPGKIFDEIYYATEGAELTQHGVEWRPENNAGDFVVHPPLGKWLIGLGELAFGEHEFGWRISAAVTGIVSILIAVRLARRLFRSTVLGCAAGLLMALDGLHLVLSRSALLDIFLMFFILAAFGCLVMDRDNRRRRWLHALEHGLVPGRHGPAGRPRLGIPWWRLAGAVMIGCAASVKWSAIWYLPLFIVLIYVWEIGVRRAAGAPHPWRDAFLDETGWVAAFLGLSALTYLGSWTGWFVTDTGWDRHWLTSQGRTELPIIGALENLYHYHIAALHFHDTLVSHHTYQSWPWQWLLLGRPVAFYWSGDGPCNAPSCAAEVLLLGTPVLWWSFLPALAGLAWFGAARRDWRAAAIGLGVVAGIVPWFWYELSDRTMFYFYALPAEPFLVLAVVYVLGAIMGTAPAPGRPVSDRRLVGTVVAGAYVVAVALCFAYFFPIYVGDVITYNEWWARMWLGPRWV